MFCLALSVRGWGTELLEMDSCVQEQPTAPSTDQHFISLGLSHLTGCL